MKTRVFDQRDLSCNPNFLVKIVNMNFCTLKIKLIHLVNSDFNLLVARHIKKI